MGSSPTYRRATVGDRVREGLVAAIGIVVGLGVANRDQLSERWRTARDSAAQRSNKTSARPASGGPEGVAEPGQALADACQSRIHELSPGWSYDCSSDGLNLSDYVVANVAAAAVRGGKLNLQRGQFSVVKGGKLVLL